MQASVQERLLSALGTAIIVGLLGYLLFVGMSVDLRVRAEQAIALISLTPPPPEKPRPPVIRPKLAMPSGKASPPNLRNKATAIVALPPIVPLVVPTSIVAAPKAGIGMAPSAGASDRPGPGSGAGGQGDGTGSGGSGDGDGDGGDVAPRQIKGRIKQSDIPAGLLDTGKAYALSVRYHVEVDGRVGDCAVTRSSGNAVLDQRVCNLIQQRYRFVPAHDSDGHPFETTFEEDHSWEMEREQDPGTHP